MQGLAGPAARPMPAERGAPAPVRGRTASGGRFGESAIRKSAPIQRTFGLTGATGAPESGARVYHRCFLFALKYRRTNHFRNGIWSSAVWDRSSAA